MSICYKRGSITLAYTIGARSFNNGYLHAGEAKSPIAAQSTRQMLQESHPATERLEDS